VLGPACPGVIDQEHVGIPGQLDMRSEVLRIDIPRMLGAGGGHQTYLAARGRIAEDLVCAVSCSMCSPREADLR
jgi:hypothetical protein